MPSEGGVRGVSLGDAVVTRSVQVVPVCVCVCVSGLQMHHMGIVDVN